jgi:hypothetical protein
MGGGEKKRPPCRNQDKETARTFDVPLADGSKRKSGVAVAVGWHALSRDAKGVPGGSTPFASLL